MMREMDFSLPGMAEAEMITWSPGWISTCRWLEKAMRYRADISSPCEPVETMTSLSLGTDLIWLMSTSVPSGMVR